MGQDRCRRSALKLPERALRRCRCLPADGMAKKNRPDLLTRSGRYEEGHRKRSEAAVAIERAVRASSSGLFSRRCFLSLAFHDMLLEVIDNVRRLIEGLAVDEKAWHLALAANLDEVLAISFGLIDVVERQLDIVCLHEGEDLVAPGAAVLYVELEIRRHGIRLSFAVVAFLVPAISNWYTEGSIFMLHPWMHMPCPNSCRRLTV